jgi:hypothetical protein
VTRRAGRRADAMREQLLNRLAFTVSMLIAVTLTTAVILVVAAVAHPGHGRLVVRPAATASPVSGR